MALLRGILLFTRQSFGEHSESEQLDTLINRLLNENERLPECERLCIDEEKPFDVSSFKCAECARHFIRGAFIACGSITNPGRAYRVEMTIPDAAKNELFCEFLCENGLPPKRTKRASQYVLYYKESESVEDFLTVIGAQKALFKIMDTRIYKEIRNNANRIVNCETANIDKTVSAATTHISAIEQLKNEDKLALLPEELRVTAELRLDNPDISLTELGEAHDPKISKSGVNHRLKKIVDFANSLHCAEDICGHERK